MAFTETTSSTSDRHFSFVTDIAPWKVAGFYLLTFTAAEVIVTYVSPMIGAILHTIILFALIFHCTLIPNSGLSRILIALILVPVLRLISISLPLFLFDITYWYAIISLPILLAAFIVAHNLGFSGAAIGFHLEKPLLQIVIVLLGIVFGFIEYVILRPAPILSQPTPITLLLIGFSLLIGTGFMEELVFRCIIQQAAEPVLGSRRSILFVTLLFTAMHIGWKSFPDLIFVFIVGFIWGLFFNRTRSIVGISLSHTVTNILLFVILPFIFTQSPPLASTPQNNSPTVVQDSQTPPRSAEASNSVIQPEIINPAPHPIAFFVLGLVSILSVGYISWTLLEGRKKVSDSGRHPPTKSPSAKR